MCNFVNVKRIIAPFLAILILISSTGLTYSTHFCMGRAVERAMMIGEYDLDCGMGNMDRTCESEEIMLNETSCCDNEFVAVDTDSNYDFSKVNYSIDNEVLIAFIYVFTYSNLTSNEPSQAYTDQIPPPLEHDYQSMLQNFRL